MNDDMIGIIAMKDGKFPIPIMDESRDQMATWPNLKEAKSFTETNLLCQHSECLFVNLEECLIEF